VVPLRRTALELHGTERDVVFILAGYNFLEGSSSPLADEVVYLPQLSRHVPTYGLGPPTHFQLEQVDNRLLGSGGYLCHFSCTRDTKRDIQPLDIVRTVDFVEKMESQLG